MFDLTLSNFSLLLLELFDLARRDLRHNRPQALLLFLFIFICLVVIRISFVGIVHDALQAFLLVTNG